MVEERVFLNPVECRGDILLVTLPCGKVTIVDNTESVKDILRKHKFRAMKRKNDFYYVICATRGLTLLHRMIAALDRDIADYSVYHKDGNTLNNCGSNLEVCETVAMFRKAWRAKNPVTGIHWRPDKVIATWVRADGKRRYRKFSFKCNDPDRAYDLAKHLILKKQQLADQKNGGSK
jgi:hypothetical protein